MVEEGMGREAAIADESPDGVRIPRGDHGFAEPGLPEQHEPSGPQRLAETLEEAEEREAAGELLRLRIHGAKIVIDEDWYSVTLPPLLDRDGPRPIRATSARATVQAVAVRISLAKEESARAVRMADHMLGALTYDEAALDDEIPF